MNFKYELSNNYREIIIEKICKFKNITRDYIYFNIDRSNIYNAFDDELILNENDISKVINVNFQLRDAWFFNDLVESDTIDIALKDIVSAHDL